MMECKSSSLQNLRTKIHKQVNYKIMLLDRLKYISISVVQYDEGPTKFELHRSQAMLSCYTKIL